MIGSALSRIAMADKMSVDQLKQALQDKTLPAYIAVPLLQEKMDMQARMQSAASMQQPRQLPIADQVMQRAATQSGISELPSNLPVAGMAGGGIVAFADGGDAEEDDDDEDEIDYGATRMDKENEALLMQLLASRKAAPGMGAGTLGTGLVPPTSGKNLGIEALAPGAGTPAITLSSAKEERSTGLKVPSGHKYENKIVSKAEEMGIDPKFALYLAGKETGGLKSPETAKSRAGAMGIMQLMPGTAKDMGVKDPFDPDQNIEGGLRYAKLMMDKYKDPRIAAIAYNWGPGNTDKWLRAGADPDKLPRETRQYVASLKEGGAIRFQNTGLVGDPMGTGSWEIMTGDLEGQSLADYVEEEERRRAGLPSGSVLSTGKQLPITDPKIQAKLRATTAGMSPEAREEYFRHLKGRAEGAPFGAPSPEMLKKEEDKKTADQQEGAPAAKAAPVDPFEAYLSKREKGIAAQREQDKYMALLAAGLGMMGGRSRYAAENIGQGALQGVAAMQAANKARAAEENALLAGRLGQYKSQQYEALRRDLAKQGQEGKVGQQIAYIEKAIDAAARTDVLKTGIVLDSPAGMAAISKRVAELKAANPLLAKLYKDYGLPEIQTAPMESRPRTVDEIIAEKKKRGY